MRQTYNELITDCFQEDPAARPKMEVVLERLVALQQLMVKRQREEAAHAAAGGAPPGSGGSMPSANGQSRPTIAIGGWVKSYPSGPPCTPGLASPGRSFSAATRCASNAAAAAAAAAAEQWHHQVKAPSRGWLLVAGACRAHVACFASEHMARCGSDLALTSLVRVLPGLPVLTAVLSWAVARHVYRTGR
jgi:hypothetical protein